MKTIRLNVGLRPMGTSRNRYQADFVLDRSATNSIAPASALRRAGVEPIGMMAYELTDGNSVEYPFGVAIIQFMGEITCGRVIFGPDDTEPRLGGIALASVGVVVDATSGNLRRLPAIPLK